VSDSHDPQDEASELRREIESHLEMLEEDVMKNDPNSVSATRGATRQAEERFGNAVDHFRQGLAELERGQRALRRIAVAVVLVTLLAAAGGVIFNAWIMVSIRSLMNDWSARATPVEPDWGMFRFEAVLLDFQARTPQGVVRTNGRISLHDWNALNATLRARPSVPGSGRSRGSQPWSDSEWPVIQLTAFPPEVSSPVELVAGSMVTCTPIRQFEATTPFADGVSSKVMANVLSQGVVVDCVPVPPSLTSTPRAEHRSQVRPAH
jgi:hypothetical protein